MKLQYIFPLSVIIAITITNTHNVYLYWTTIVIFSFIIAIKHGEIAWEYGETLIKSLHSYLKLFIKK